MFPRRPLTSVAAALAAGILIVGCSSTSDPETTAESPAAESPAAESTAQGAQAAVQQAANNTQEQRSARVRLDATIDVAGNSASTTGEGVIDFETGSAEMTLTSAALGDDETMSLRIVDGNGYLQMPLLGDTWVSSPDAAAVLAGSDPQNLLRQVESLSDLAAEGTEEVDGVQATRYSGSVDLAEAIESSDVVAGAAEQLQNSKDLDGEASVDVWVDDSDRVIRIRQAVTLAQKKRQVSQSSDISFSDFGVAVDVEAPDPADVIDSSQLGGEGLPTTP